MIGGGIAALGLGGLGVSGLFSGAGVLGGMGAGLATLPATTPLFVAASGTAAAYKGYQAFQSVKGVDELPPQNWLEEKAARFDNWASRKWNDVSSALLGRGGPQAPAEVKTKLEGSAEIQQRLVIEPSPLFDARIDQRISASGALRADTVGTTMKD